MPRRRHAAATDLLAAPQPPTAIIASNDQMALATMEVARERGRSVPRDLSVVSFDDTPIVRFVRPPLTAIAQPAEHRPLAAIAAPERHARDPRDLRHLAQ